MDEKNKPKRVFVVGCPRSGTTLVQSILADKKRFVSFPESGVFCAAIPGLRFKRFGNIIGIKFRLLYLLGTIFRFFNVMPFRLRSSICYFLDKANLKHEIETLPKNPLFISPLIRSFVDILDRNSGDIGWIEKTPNHLFCIDLIEKYVPDAMFIHIVRNGEATIASIYDAAQKHEYWEKRYFGAPNDIEKLVSLWNRAYQVSQDHKVKKNHLLVNYEDLTKNTENEIQRISQFLDIDYSARMMEVNADDYILSFESWKKQMDDKIQYQESKFHDVLNDNDQAYVKNHLIKKIK